MGAEILFGKLDRFVTGLDHMLDGTGKERVMNAGLAALATGAAGFSIQRTIEKEASPLTRGAWGLAATLSVTGAALYLDYAVRGEREPAPYAIDDP